MLRAGDLIVTDEGQEVAREVVVVVRLANGVTTTYATTDTVEVVSREDLSELVEVVQGMESEV